MASFDLAAGITAAGINNILGQLFANSTLQAKLFTGSKSKTISPGKTVDLSYTVNNAPTITLSAPTKAEWDAGHQATPLKPIAYPSDTSNLFQLDFSSNTLKVTETNESPVNETGSISCYGSVALNDGKLAFTIDVIALDETKFDGLDEMVVNLMVIPKVLDFANGALSGITIPTIPTFSDTLLGKTITLSFHELVGGITNNQLVVATSLTSNPSPSIDGFTNPTDKNIFVASNLNTANELLAQIIDGFSHTGSGEKGDAVANAEYSYTVGVNTAVIQARDGAFTGVLGLPTLNASAGIGGAAAIAKDILCPIATAADAISGQSLTKITAVISGTVSPNPISVPFTAGIGAAGPHGQPIGIHIGQLEEINVTIKPDWSGVIGSTFASMVAALADIIPTEIKTMIVNKIIQDNFASITLYTLPILAKTVEGVTATATATAGSLTVYGPDLVGTSFDVTIS